MIIHTFIPLSSVWPQESITALNLHSPVGLVDYLATVILMKVRCEFKLKLRVLFFGSLTGCLRLVVGISTDPKTHYHPNTVFGHNIVMILQYRKYCDVIYCNILQLFMHFNTEAVIFWQHLICMIKIEFSVYSSHLMDLYCRWSNHQSSVSWYQLVNKPECNIYSSLQWLSKDK